MATIEVDNRAAPEDQRMVVAEGKRYFYKTTSTCTTCNRDGRDMYVKFIINAGSDSVIECPVCENNITLKTAMVRRAE